MYDLAIIGGGPAGYSAAFEAAAKNMSAILFEKSDLGGTCLNRGCVPTKYLSHIARKFSDLSDSGKDGIFFDALRYDHERSKKRMEEIVLSLREGLKDSLLHDKVKVVSKEAKIVSEGVISCNGEKYQAKNILIATGSEAAPSPVRNAHISDELLLINKIPEKLHIIGGGTIAVEFSSIFRMLGSEVTLSIRGDRILRKWDRDISISLTQSLKKKGIVINRNCDFSSFKKNESEYLLSATGRRAYLPDSEGGLFEVGEKGGIITDGIGRTKTPGIFAAGDVREDSPDLAHLAMEQGRRVVRLIAGEEVKENTSVIRCIYTDQETASAGLAEAEAEERGISFVSAKQTMYSNARTMISSDQRGFIKVLAGADRRIIGAHLYCEHAGEIISEFALAMDQGITADEMIRTVRPHPSYSEAVTEALRILVRKLDEV